MGLTVRYKTDDEKTKVTSISFVFGGIPGAVFWGNATTTTDSDGVVTMACYNLECEGVSLDTADLSDITLAGGLWFGNGVPYGSKVEFLSAEFFGMGPERKSFPVKIRKGDK